MNELKTSIITSIGKYYDNLRYFAIEDKKTSSDIMLLIISDEVYDWANWYNAPQSDQLKLQKFRKSIIKNNTNLTEFFERTNKYYKNVSLPQTIYTWQRIYDSKDLNIDSNGNVILIDEIYSLIDENNNYIIQ